MNVLFVNPEIKDYSRSVTTPLGLLSIASTLQANGFCVRIYDRTVQKESLSDVLQAFPPDLAGVSLVSFKSFFDALDVSEQLKNHSVPVVWGGPLASELPEATLKNACVDAVSVGEGEHTWLELARAVQKGKTDFTDIRGLALRTPDGGVLRTEDRPFIELGELPDLDWELIPVEKYFQSNFGCRRMLYIYAAKGCPNNCTFCYNKDFHKCKYRKRPLDAVLRDIRYLVENHGADGVYFADELWCRSKQELRDVCDSLRSLQLDVRWGCQTRVGLFDEIDFKYMYDAGCRWILFGVESGSRRILADMNKHIDYDKIEPTIRDCRSAGISPVGSFIIGYPGETTEDARETVALIERLDTDLISLNTFMVFPATDIYFRLVREGKYQPITDLRTLAKEDPMRNLCYNYSDIPDRDLKVLQATYMWRSFEIGGRSIDGKRATFSKKVIEDALRSLNHDSVGSFLWSAWRAGTEFLHYFYYAHAYPKIQKKYGIRQK